MPIDRDFADTHEAPVEGIPLSLYPDYTVGPGIAPGLLSLSLERRSRARRSASLPPVGNFAPP